MKMEDLTKSQIVLLTLLVSFVTSIATGIVTVALMDQAPTEVTRTINRIVERTVETVVPPSISGTQEAQVVTKETTIVVKDEDLITDAIKANSELLIRLFEEQGVLSESGVVDVKRHFVGYGVMVASGGILATDSAIVQPGAVYIALSARNAEALGAGLVYYDPKEKTALLQLKPRESGGAVKLPPEFPAPKFADAASYKIGQTVITLGGDVRDQADIGILSSVQEKTLDSGGTMLVSLATSIRSADATGGPLFNIFGELLAVSVVGATGNPGFIPIRLVRDQLAVFEEKGAQIRALPAPLLPAEDTETSAATL